MNSFEYRLKAIREAAFTRLRPPVLEWPRRDGSPRRWSVGAHPERHIVTLGATGLTCSCQKARGNRWHAAREDCPHTRAVQIVLQEAVARATTRNPHA